MTRTRSAVVRHLLPFTGIILLVTALTGCARSDADLRAKVAEIKARDGQGIERVPALRTFERATYEASGLRDPFSPSPNRATVDSGQRPDENRPREALEAFPLDSLDMVGTIGAGAQMLALLKDPTGLVHQVDAGAYIGQNFGRIQGITETGVALVELVPNGSGGWIERQASVALDD